MTADQAIALTSVIVSGVVAALAVAASIWTGYVDRRDQREQAKVNRQQPRLERTYLELAGYVHRRRMEANAIRPYMTFPGQPPPEPVTAAETERVQTLVVSIASRAVRSILEEFAGVVTDIHNADTVLSGMERAAVQSNELERADASEKSAADYRKGILADQHRLTEIEDRLHEQIRSELAA